MGATVAALISGVGWFVLVAAEMNEVAFVSAWHASVLGPVWLQTRFGAAWRVRSMLWFIGAAAASGRPWFGRVRWVALTAGAGLVGSLAWAGHGGTGPAHAWHLTADVLHLLASAVWPAGLVPLALLLRQITAADTPNRWPDAVRLVRRFSAASLTAVALLTLTGLFDSWCLVGSFDGLFSTRYGRVLLFKIVLFGFMVGLGAVNWLVLSPRLRREPLAAAATLRRTVAGEIVLAAAVVAVVGLLGLLEPARM